jgi:hypothetical protein
VNAQVSPLVSKKNWPQDKLKFIADKFFGTAKTGATAPVFYCPLPVESAHEKLSSHPPNAFRHAAEIVNLVVARLPAIMLPF